MSITEPPPRAIKHEQLSFLKQAKASFITSEVGLGQTLEKMLYLIPFSYKGFNTKSNNPAFTIA